jgi:hypothetical protein
MSVKQSLPTPEALKLQAKRLRSGLEKQGDFISHAEALELLAAQFGYRDWNTLRAAADQPSDAAPYGVGDRVKGRYLGQAFTGEILGVRRLGAGARHQLVIEFDTPVDVVKFDSFSSPRRRIDYLVDTQGRSWEKTSDGEPHLQLVS